MEKRMLWLGLILMVFGLCSSGAFAASMGPPVAGLEGGKWSIGIDYANTDMTVASKGAFIDTADKTSPPRSLLRRLHRLR